MCAVDLVETRFITLVLLAPSTGLLAYCEPPPSSARTNYERRRRTGVCHRGEVIAEVVGEGAHQG
jgi:hypothetical protein